MPNADATADVVYASEYMTPLVQAPPGLDHYYQAKEVGDFKACAYDSKTSLTANNTHDEFAELLASIPRWEADTYMNDLLSDSFYTPARIVSHGQDGFQAAPRPEAWPSDLPLKVRIPTASGESNLCWESTLAHCDERMPDAHAEGKDSWDATAYQWGKQDSCCNSPSSGYAVQVPGSPHMDSSSNENWSSVCRWHKSANAVGVISEDGHVFTKYGGSSKVVMAQGMPVELSSICMVFDESLRHAGTHLYTYQILDGELGAADGAGFVFDSQVRRNNIQRMRSVFLNQRGRICVRNREHVRKLDVQLPPLAVGMWLTLEIDLDSQYLQFVIYNAEGNVIGVADLSFGGLFPGTTLGQGLASGFFCAVVTKHITVALA